jgi:hypothetical protein
MPTEGPTRRPGNPQRGGNARRIQNTSFISRWFELNLKIVQKVRIYSVIQDLYRAEYQKKVPMTPEE